MDLSVDRAVESGLISEGDDILDLWFAKQEKEVNCMSKQNGYTTDSEHILSSGHDLKKLAEAMGWRKMDGETYIDLFERLGHTVQQLPDPSIN